MLDIQGLSVNIGATPILRDVSLSIGTGSMCGLIGRNGAGKTTLLRSVMGLLPSSGGSIVFNQDNLQAEADYRRAHLVICLKIAD